MRRIGSPVAREGFTHLRMSPKGQCGESDNWVVRLPADERKLKPDGGDRPTLRRECREGIPKASLLRVEENRSHEKRTSVLDVEEEGRREADGVRERSLVQDW